jgi:hypothetical protein
MRAVLFHSLITRYVSRFADQLDYARGLVRYVAEGHLNPDGNRRVAEIIAHWIEGQIEPGQTAADTKAQTRDPWKRP